MKRLALVFILGTLITALPALAKEGMWRPSQLPQLADDLEELGLEISPEQLASLTAHPLGAVISLGGCTASFVSPDGLVVTNHHCTYGALQHNSDGEKNLFRDGFLARDRSEEASAGPGRRLWVTVDVTDVTKRVKKGLGDRKGRDLYQAIENHRKEIVAECEEDEGHRCRVAAFNGNLEYSLIKQLELRDVRLVYAPAGAVGKYGGDIDNWMWPRHTGDFAFYRGYIGPDGKPAGYDEKNVPYRPRHYLKLDDDGVDPDDFVMVAGYPGRTNRYRMASEVEHTFGWSYPHSIELFQKALDIIADATRDNPDAKVKYTSRVNGINNRMKNYQGLLDGFAKGDTLERKKRLEEELTAWIDDDDGRHERFAGAFDDLGRLIAEGQEARKRFSLYEEAARQSSLLQTASRLYRLSLERQKPDAERKAGYQERDSRRHRQRLMSLDRSFHPDVDRALWYRGILEYAKLGNDQRVEAFDTALGLKGRDADAEALGRLLAKMYEATELTHPEKRQAWLEADPEAFEKSSDPFIRLAVELYPSDHEDEIEDEERMGRFQELRPIYMEALIAYLDSQGESIYPDANSTLRVTYGTVQGYSPRDGAFYMPFTTLRGILQKDTGEEPFDAPQPLLEAARTHRHGPYGVEELDSVPVNFLSDLDITGGNSGSATLNDRGELVGLAFDGNWESVISDWDFMPDITRSIHVDVRYMLWVMDYIDSADHLIEEMGLEATPEIRRDKAPIGR